MAEQLDLTTFTGAHPTNEEFVGQLREWGFAERRVDGVHLVLRGPHGGTLRVLRSLLGRADAVAVAKAARLVGVDLEQFWRGPEPADDETAAPTGPTTLPVPPGRRRTPATRDRIVSMVLAAHTSTDRPLGFDQVVRLCRGRISRAQAQSASATLCRDGDLDRIRAGVYQWSGGSRAIPIAAAEPAPPRPPSPAAPRRAQLDQASRSAGRGAHPTAVELFDRLFPAGVRMNAELLGDFDQWAELTEKFAAAYTEAS
jgi:hypothetical protein